MTLTLDILRMLRDVNGLLMPERQIRAELRIAVTPPPTGLEVGEALQTLEARQLAISIRDPLTKEVRWKITDQGRAELTERSL